MYLAVHFTAIFLYALPTNSENKFKYLVFPYVYPYFHQDWRMFAPIPKQNFNVYVKHDSKDWKDIFYTVNSAHQKNRLAGNEALLLALSNSLRYYASSVEEITKSESDDASNINFVVLRKIVRNYLALENGTDVKNVEIIIGIKDVERKVKHYHHYKLND